MGNESKIGVIVIGIWLLCVGGWIANIVKLAGADYFGGMVIVRVIGIFVAPLGSFLGFV